MPKTTQKSSTVAGVRKKPAARASGTSWPVLYNRVKLQHGESESARIEAVDLCDRAFASASRLALQNKDDRARIEKLTSKLEGVTKDNEKLKDKLKDVVADRNSLHEEVMMHSDDCLAVSSDEVTARRRRWP